MSKLRGAEDHDITCPFCKSQALYKYGRIKTGKQRYLCMICGKQFTPGVRRIEMEDRPFCPGCGRPMHVYKRENEVIRFRCSDYPECKTYTKISKKKETMNELLLA